MQNDFGLTPEQIAALPTRTTKTGPRAKSHLPYEMAKATLREQAPHVTSANKYRKWIKDSNSYFMPVHPERVYSNFDWADFLGKAYNESFAAGVHRRRVKAARYRPMWDAIKWAQRYCRENGIKRESDWHKAYEEDRKIPEDIPKHPKLTYKDQGYPGFRIWCGRDAVALTEAAGKAQTVLTLLHPVNTPVNVLQLVTWRDGIGQLREVWRKQPDFDRIIGCWNLEPELMPEVERILSDNGSSDGERFIFPNVNQVTWELNSLLEMVRP